jgi:rod shape determining protein RodA
MLFMRSLFGHTANGAQRWISFGFVLFQPSELMKLSMIIALARYFDDHKANEPYLLRELFVPFLMVMIPCVLILKQPDLGTALMIVIVSASIVLFIGMNWKSLAIVAASILVMLPVAWHFLKDYQKDRLLTFLSRKATLWGQAITLFNP